MRQLIFVIAGAIVLLGAAYLFLFKRDKLKELAEEAQGYGPAKTAKECVDQFVKAIKERKYNMAAKYVTAKYAEELRKGHEAGNELATAIDNLISRMQNDGVMTDEMKIVLYFYDPFYKEITVAVEKETDSTAQAIFTAEGITLAGQGRQYENWSIDNRMFRTLSVDWPLPPKKFSCPMKKEEDGWKIDVPVSQNQQAATQRLKDKYKDYTRPLEILSREIKNEPSTKENVKKRMKELLEEAARN